MSAPAGFKIGAFEVLSLVGAGGMGQVYRARDTRLGRIVAIKVLSDELTRDPGQIERFTREARILASLNHANIATIHGIENTDDGHALVMELVEGQTLDDMVTRRGAGRPLALDEALDIARQIADALDTAHGKGVIHRDLKPANVMITPGGVVKVLDFGLAKVQRDASATNQTEVTLQHATEHGGLLGTAPYMSPEQARGTAVDKRSDIWAFGCVLYELLSGQRAFAGETPTDVLGAILHRDPDWSALPGTTPPRIARLVRHCLEKDPKRRLRDIGDALPEIDEGRSDAIASPAAPAPRRGRWISAVAAAALLGLALGGLGAWARFRETSAAKLPARTTHLSILTPTDARVSPSPQFSFSTRGTPVLSPDGSRVVYVAERPGGDSELYVRQLDEFGVRPIAGTNGASAPFFSPDGASIAFFAGTKLKRIPAAGGAVTNICDVPEDAGGSGGAWSADGTIVFAVSAAARQGLFQVPASGGTPKVVTQPDPTEGGSYGSPALVDDGSAVLFVTRFAKDQALKVRSLRTGEQRDLITGNVERPLYVPAGRLIYASGTTLMAVRFDPSRLELVGEPVPVLEDVAGSTVSIAASGSLAYSVPSSSFGNLVWVSREGAVRSLLNGSFLRPRLSNDGRRLAVETSTGSGTDIAVYAFDNQTLTLLNTHGGNSPNWSGGDRMIDFRSIGGIFEIAADGANAPLPILMSKDLGNENQGPIAPGIWSPDRSTYIFVRQRPSETAADIWALRAANGRAIEPLVERPRNQWAVKISPDGRWISYASDESGQFEIFVQALDAGGARTQISAGGGWQGVWSPRGDEIFYRSGDRMMAVSIATKPKLVAGRPRELFRGTFTSTDIPNYDVNADATEWVMVQQPDEAEGRSIRLIDHWTDELQRLVPMAAAR